MNKDEPKAIGRPSVYGERRSFNVQIPVELADRLDAWRATKGLSRAAAIQQAVEKFLRKR